jgi:hypothetical protein
MVLARPRVTTKNQIKKQIISSQTFHRTPSGRVQETTVRKQFKPRILKSFDPVTQEQYQIFTCNNPHNNPKKNRSLWTRAAFLTFTAWSKLKNDEYTQEQGTWVCSTGDQTEPNSRKIE